MFALLAFPLNIFLPMAAVTKPNSNIIFVCPKSVCHCLHLALRWSLFPPKFLFELFPDDGIDLCPPWIDTGDGMLRHRCLLAER